MNFAVRPVLLRPLRFLPPLPYSMLVHLLYQRRVSTFRNPRTMTELIVAKKLWDKNPQYVHTADKFRARDFVAERAGEHYLVPLLQYADTPEELDFDALTAPCVIKARHGYDMNIIIRPGEYIDRDAILATTRQWMTQNIYDRWKEWAYLDCPPGIMVEEFLGDDEQPPADYKVYVFHGRAGMIQVDNDRFLGHKVNLFDHEWNELDFEGSFPMADPSPERPENLQEILNVAEKVACDMPFARVDLYNVDGRIYFGEVTHYPGAGCVAHKPDEFDHAIGNLWRNGTPFPQRFLKKRTAPSHA